MYKNVLKATLIILAVIFHQLFTVSSSHAYDKCANVGGAGYGRLQTGAFYFCGAVWDNVNREKVYNSEKYQDYVDKVCVANNKEEFDKLVKYAYGHLKIASTWEREDNSLTEYATGYYTDLISGDSSYYEFEIVADIALESLCRKGMIKYKDGKITKKFKIIDGKWHERECGEWDSTAKKIISCAEDILENDEHWIEMECDNDVDHCKDYAADGAVYVGLDKDAYTPGWGSESNHSGEMDPDIFTYGYYNGHNWASKRPYGCHRKDDLCSTVKEIVVASDIEINTPVKANSFYGFVGKSLLNPLYLKTNEKNDKGKFIDGIDPLPARNLNWIINITSETDKKLIASGKDSEGHLEVKLTAPEPFKKLTYHASGNMIRSEGGFHEWNFTNLHLSIKAEPVDNGGNIYRNNIIASTVINPETSQVTPINFTAPLIERNFFDHVVPKVMEYGIIRENVIITSNTNPFRVISGNEDKEDKSEFKGIYYGNSYSINSFKDEFNSRLQSDNEYKPVLEFNDITSHIDTANDQETEKCGYHMPGNTMCNQIRFTSDRKWIHAIEVLKDGQLHELFCDTTSSPSVHPFDNSFYGLGNYQNVGCTGSLSVSDDGTYQLWVKSGNLWWKEDNLDVIIHAYDVVTENGFTIEVTGTSIVGTQHLKLSSVGVDDDDSWDEWRKEYHEKQDANLQFLRDKLAHYNALEIVENHCEQFYCINETDEEYKIKCHERCIRD